MATNIKAVPDVPEDYDLTGKKIMVHDITAPDSADSKRLPATFFLFNPFEEKTYLEATALISANNIRPGVAYKITDRGDSGIYLQGLRDNALSQSGIRAMLCPAWYGTGSNGGNNWVGVWNPTKTAAANDLAIWGGLVWKNLTGDIGTAPDSFSLDATNWVLIAKNAFTHGEYIELFFDVNYDFNNDWIEKQQDGSGNIVGLSSAQAAYLGWMVNPTDITDWNMATSGNSFSGNRVVAVSNNSNSGGIFNNQGAEVMGNYNGGDIDDNYTLWGLKDNTNGGYIQFNRCADIQINSNSGGIYGNVVPGSINENSNIGDIGENSVVSTIAANWGPVTDIKNNACTGGIYGNQNAGAITNNQINGDIRYNLTNGYITFNRNNGHIAENTSLAGAPVNITKNSNNGNIGVASAGNNRTAHITDTLVNK